MFFVKSLTVEDLYWPRLALRFTPSDLRTFLEFFLYFLVYEPCSINTARVTEDMMIQTLVRLDVG